MKMVDAPFLIMSDRILTFITDCVTWLILHWLVLLSRQYVILSSLSTDYSMVFAEKECFLCHVNLVFAYGIDYTGYG